MMSSLLSKIFDVSQLTLYNHSLSNDVFYWYWKYRNQEVFCKTINRSNIDFFVKNLTYFSNHFPTCGLVDLIKLTKSTYLMVFDDYQSWYKQIYNWIEFLNNKSISQKTKTATLSSFYKSLFSVAKTTMHYSSFKNYPSKVLFEDRLWNKRLYNYYGLRYKNLLLDIKKNCKESEYMHIKKILLMVNQLAKRGKKTCLVVSHGDLHDMNYLFHYSSKWIYDVLFVDNDTVWKNPFIADFVCYYWYLLYQRDNVIYPYKRSFFWKNNRFNKTLSDKQLQLYLNIYFFPALKLIPSDFERKDEFVWRFVLRVLWVFDVLNFSDKDKKRIYFVLDKLYLWYFSDKSDLLPFTHII